MPNHDIRELEPLLLKQMDVIPETLKKWENDAYLADPQIVSKFWSKIEMAKEIRIVGDYDVDGISASYILFKAIKNIFPNKKTIVRIPRRFSEGYGINETIANEIIETMPRESLVITVDNGISSASVLERLKKMGFQVIITDHHDLKKGGKLPDVDMIINPTIKSIPNPLGIRGWCGAGVVYKLIESMVSKEDRTEFKTFAGLATIADCMDLKEGNWGLVRHAIKSFRNGEAPYSLKLLIKEMKKSTQIVDEETFGYYLGPAINASGRLYDKGAIKVLKYLYTPTPEGAQNLVATNERRKSIRDEEFEIVKKYIVDNNKQNDCPIWVNVPNLNEGIVGILAGKLSEEYKKPTIVLTNKENDLFSLKGSARTYGDFNIFKYLCSLPQNLFEKVGGHSGAAGLSITMENFKIASSKKYQTPIKEIVDTTAENNLIFDINPKDIPKINKILFKYKPFGQKNPPPMFQLKINLKTMPGEFKGKEKNHLFIDGPNKKNSKFQKEYQIIHFFHSPNDLLNKNLFQLCGKISSSGFKNIETPTFNAEQIEDVLVDRKLSEFSLNL